MADLYWEPSAWATYQGLDTQRVGLQNAVESVLDRLTSNPTVADVRVLALRTRSGRTLWRIPIRRSVEDWSLVWLPHPERPGDVLIVYLGPANFVTR